MKKTIVELPDEFVQKLQLDNEQLVEMQIIDDQIIIDKNIENIRQDNKVAFRWVMATGVISALIAVINFIMQQTTTVGMTGANSLTQITIYLGGGFGTFSFLIMAIKTRNREGHLIRWYNILMITLAYGIIGIVALALVMWVISSAFAGARLDIYTMSLIIGALVGTMNYIMVITAQGLRFQQAVSVLIATLFGGIIMSMATNGSVGWWQYNFSYLGTNRVGNGWIFNFTLIFSSLILLTIVDYLFSSLGATFRQNRRLFILRLLFSITAIAVGLIGVFPNNPGWMHHVHDGIAQWLVMMVLVMIIAIRWLIPNPSWEFLVISYVMAGGLAISDIVFKKSGYLSLTAFEMVAFGFAFAWLILLLQNLRNLSYDDNPKYVVKLEIADLK
ncbi:hypothetical protein WKK_04785 [Weissella koreensis KACC 15510]|uniref:DUF998 domain-containing protein n=1 Tax=Weissella koreensis TaxID=165096 RepID=UPI0002174B0F|nr:DUF998 domain-containing protein [Weissella koreensis]AEJ23829.1 hypothetical protein WKK_04785 [Weissella koreensis KACC 15510]